MGGLGKGSSIKSNIKNSPRTCWNGEEEGKGKEDESRGKKGKRKNFFLNKLNATCKNYIYICAPLVDPTPPSHSTQDTKKWVIGRIPPAFL